MPPFSPAPPPVISVIVPVYNVAGYVAACLQSLARQTFPQFEVLVIDDGSTDDSAEVVADTIRGDARFRLITRENGGLSAARNTGLRHARGDFIAFVDGDDRVDPAYLEAMHDALADSGSDWVACAIRYDDADGTSFEHSAIHDDPKLPAEEDREIRRFALTDWPGVIRHFPSAWNKLYRRRLIDGLRYDEGTYYEDHAFFYRAAQRSDHILHVPRPLYFQTQGREGQITGEDSDRIFEQFTVLDTMWQIMRRPGKTRAREGFRRIASRLMVERADAIADPGRRMAFSRACRKFFDRHGLEFSADWDEALPVGWGRVIEGHPPLSVIIPSDGTPEPLIATLEHLALQRPQDFEVIVVFDCDAELPLLARLEIEEHLPGVILLTNGKRGVHSARNRGLDQARGDCVLFLDAGDWPLEHALAHWTQTMLRSGADLGLSQYFMQRKHGPRHSGFHTPNIDQGPPAPGLFRPTRKLAMNAQIHPSAKIYARAFLLREDIRFAPEPMSAWSILSKAMSRARSAWYFDHPGVVIAEGEGNRRIWKAPSHPDAIHAALKAADPTPRPGELQRLFIRTIWEKHTFAAFESEQDRGDFLRAARRHIRALHPDPQLDYFVGPHMRRKLGLMREALPE